MGRKICLGERDGLCFVLFLWCFHNFGKDVFKSEHRVVQVSLPNLAFSSCTQRCRSPYHSPVTTSPAGPPAKSTLSVKNKHGQVCSTWGARGLGNGSREHTPPRKAASPVATSPGHPQGCLGFWGLLGLSRISPPVTGLWKWLFVISR